MKNVNIKMESDNAKFQNWREKLLLWKKIVFFAIVAAAIVLSILFWKSAHTLTVISTNAEGFEVGTGYQDFALAEEESRFDVLLLGMRGHGDPEGGILADTVMLASFDEKTGKAALVSIPRDLYVDLPGQTKKVKINEIYALGEQHSPGGGGIGLAKQVVSYLSGIYIDHAVVVNFEAFYKLIDHVGGVEITRSVPFKEDKQWRFEGVPGSPYWHKENDSSGEEGWVFEVPAGKSVLDANSALYYARSRYASSDFDRMHRQQEIIFALKNKITTLGELANPLRLFRILDILGSNVETDMNITEINEALENARSNSWDNVSKFVIDDSEAGLLVEDRILGQFVLLPKDGNFQNIRQFFHSVLR